MYFSDAHIWTQRVAQHFHHLHVNASCGSESSHFEWIMLPLHVSCYHLNVSCSPEYIMWSLTCHLWMRHVTVLHVIQRNTHTHVSCNHCESPISPQSLTCSLQRVTPYPTLGVLPYLLLLTCRLQWVPTPYTWSSNRASRCPALIIIPVCVYIYIYK